MCDFGIAKFKDRTFVSTVNGQAGTPAYMAPELFDGLNATEKVDVYSFAVLLWECLTGKVPVRRVVFKSHSRSPSLVVRPRLLARQWGHVPSPMQIIYYVGVLNQRPVRFATLRSSRVIPHASIVDPTDPLARTRRPCRTAFPRISSS